MYIRIFFIFCLFVCGISNAQLPVPATNSSSQNIPSTESLREINAIKIVFDGAQNISSQAVLAHIKIRKGDILEQRQLDLSIRSLYETGLYEFIQADKEVLDSSKVDVIFTIVPKFRVSEVVFEGAKNFSASRLSDEISTKAGSVLDEVLVKKDADSLFEFYQDKAYPLSTIEYDIQKNEKTGLGAVIFKIKEGTKVTIENITFVGNEIIDSDDLVSAMNTSTFIPVVSWITDDGYYVEDTFQKDLQILRDFYLDKGFLDVEINESEVKFDFPDKENPGEMDIIIKLTEGHQYKVGVCTVSGNKIYDTKTIEKIVNSFIKTGDIFSPSVIDKLTTAIKDYYGMEGYLDTYVRAVRASNTKTGDIDINFSITESEKFYVESINIQGNSVTKSAVIIREIALAPGDVFDLVRMKSSQARLRNTRFFDEVNLSPEQTNVPNRRNLKITVKEGRTGAITFGAGFSTVESIVGYAEISESNFDWLGYDKNFKGAGQKFRIRLSIGDESSQILLSFEEPWLCQRQLAFGFEAYRVSSDYYSDYYEEMRLGAQVYLRKRLFELVEGKLSYTIENVDISDLESNTPNFIREDSGNTLKSMVGLTLLRDTRDDLMMPSSGSRLELINEIAGGALGGETSYYKVEARAGKWFPTFDFGKQVFSIVARAGSMTSLGSGDIPFYDKFYLGGSYNMRGFEYREVGPMEDGEPMGGQSFGFVSLEYSIEVFNPVRFAVFYDWGFVNSGSWDFDPSDYNDDFGVGLRILIFGAPMRIDLGFPRQTGSSNDEGMQFNFSFGTVF